MHVGTSVHALSLIVMYDFCRLSHVHANTPRFCPTMSCILLVILFIALNSRHMMQLYNTSTIGHTVCVLHNTICVA